MFHKLSKATLLSISTFLIMLADMAISSTSFGHHGEPDCPEELLK